MHSGNGNSGCSKSSMNSPCLWPHDLGELDAILVELRALLRDQVAHISNLIQERRHRAELEHVLAKSA